MSELNPVLKAAISFAYLGGFVFTVAGLFLSYRQGRPHTLLLLCVSAISFSWIEAPYDWAMYAQFPPGDSAHAVLVAAEHDAGGRPARGGPPGYIAYFVLPAATGVSLRRRLVAKFSWRRPTTLLVVGLVVGSLWAFVFNGILAGC